MRAVRKRLTYANVMSSIAVFLILGGATAFAAKKIGANQLKPNSVTTAKLKKNSVTSTKIKNNAITGAKIATGAVSASKLAAGFVAPAAEKLSRYANVSANGTILAGSLGIAQANVTNPGAGFYCLSGLTPAPVGGVATIDYSESGTKDTVQFDTTPGPVCPAGTQAFVNTRDGTGTATNAGFFLVIY